MGDAKPAALAKVETVAVTMFKNQTLHPRAEALATSAVTHAFAQDGTYRLVQVSAADAVLEGSLKRIDYRGIRGTRRDTLLPEELANEVVLEWKLLDAKNPLKVLATGSSIGKSQLFAGGNLQTARNNALPEALEVAAEALVAQLATGF